VTGSGCGAAAALALALVLAGPATGQETVRFHGRVQFISGTQMVMTTDNGLSLAVDLLTVDQRSYEDLAGGAGVTVIGRVTSDRSRVAAEQVIPDPSTGPATPRF
jgi:hypothetical protein